MRSSRRRRSTGSTVRAHCPSSRACCGPTAGSASSGTTSIRRSSGRRSSTPSSRRAGWRRLCHGQPPTAIWHPGSGRGIGARSLTLMHRTVLRCLARVDSMSWIAVRPEQEREEIKRRVGELLDTHPELAGRESFDLAVRNERVLGRKVVTQKLSQAEGRLGPWSPPMDRSNSRSSRPPHCRASMCECAVSASAGWLRSAVACQMLGRDLVAHVVGRVPIDGGTRLQLDSTTPLDRLAVLAGAEQECCPLFTFPRSRWTAAASGWECGRRQRAGRCSTHCSHPA